MGHRNSKSLEKTDVHVPTARINMVEILRKSCIFEFLCDFGRMSRTNPCLKLVIAGFIRNVSNNILIPLEINGVILEFFLVVVSKYEITVLLDRHENIKNTYYEENINNGHIAFFDIKEEFEAIRIKAILNDGTETSYSEWVKFRCFHSETKYAR
eukprot:UN07279